MNIKPTEFIKTIYQYQSFKDDILPNLTDQKFKGKLGQYTLPKDMPDSEIQKETKSNPIPIEILASVIQETIKNDTNKSTYIFHTKIGNKVLVLSISWLGDGWDSFACSFDYADDWNQGRVFVALQDTQTINFKTLKTLDNYTNNELLDELKKRLS